MSTGHHSLYVRGSIISQDIKSRISDRSCFCNKVFLQDGVVNPKPNPQPGGPGDSNFGNHNLNRHLVASYDTLASRQPYSSRSRGLHGRKDAVGTGNTCKACQRPVDLTALSLQNFKKKLVYFLSHLQTLLLDRF